MAKYKASKDSENVKLDIELKKEDIEQIKQYIDKLKIEDLDGRTTRINNNISVRAQFERVGDKENPNKGIAVHIYSPETENGKFNLYVTGKTKEEAFKAFNEAKKDLNAIARKIEEQEHARAAIAAAPAKKKEEEEKDKKKETKSFEGSMEIPKEPLQKPLSTDPVITATAKGETISNAANKVYSEQLPIERNIKEETNKDLSSVSNEALENERNEILKRFKTSAIKEMSNNYSEDIPPEVEDSAFTGYSHDTPANITKRGGIPKPGEFTKGFEPRSYGETLAAAVNAMDFSDTSDDPVRSLYEDDDE